MTEDKSIFKEQSLRALEKPKREQRSSLTVERGRQDVEISDAKKKVRQGWSGPKIKEHLMQTYSINASLATKILKTAYNQIVDYNDKVSDKIAAIQLARVEEILQDCMENGDRAQALKAIEIINKMFCLYVERQDINVHGDIIKFEFDLSENTPQPVNE